MFKKIGNVFKPIFDYILTTIEKIIAGIKEAIELGRSIPIVGGLLGSGEGTNTAAAQTDQSVRKTQNVNNNVTFNLTGNIDNNGGGRLARMTGQSLADGGETITMTSYILRYTVDGIERERRLSNVETLSYAAPQAIVKKESVGGDGGLVVNTGRLIKEMTLSGELLQTRIPGTTTIVETWNDVKTEIEMIKERGYTIELESPLDFNDANKYIIEDFTADLTKGKATSLPFTIKIVENRQANVRQDIINLIAIGPRQEFLDRYLATVQGVN